jgi:hypothetical protein
MTATVTPTSGSGTPTGVVDFFNGSSELGFGNLTGGVATYNYNPSTLAIGTYPITAAYSGDGTFAASTSSAETLTISAFPAAATPSFSPAGGTYTSPQTVTISDTTTGATIYFTDDGSTPTIDSEVYSGPITVNSTEIINAIAGGTGLSNSAVATATYTITLSPDYQLSVSPTTLSIVAGQSGTATFTVTPMNGFDSPVNFICSGLPAEATCSVSPSSVTPSGIPVTSTLTVSTTAASAALRDPRPSNMRLVYALMIPGLGIIAGFKRRRKPRSRCLVFLGAFAGLLLLVGIMSCGGGSSTTTTTTNPPPNSGTPSGSNSVTVTASAGGSDAITHNSTLTITITQ